MSRWTRSQWLLTIAVLIGVELVLLGGSSGRTSQAGRHPVDGVAYALLAIIGLAIVAARRWPIAAFGVTIAATLAYAALQYPTDGPVFLGIPVTLYFSIRTDNMRQSIGLGAVATLALFVAFVVFTPTSRSPAEYAVLPVAIAAVVLVASLANLRSRELEELRQAHAERMVTEERLRIARELHDVVSHSISMINVQAGAGAHVIDQHPEQAREALLTIRAASKEALRELRGILGVLRSVDGGESRAPAPGLAALDGLLEATTQAGLPTTVTITGEVQRLSPAVDLTAYRIIQESLTNALRYAGPATAQVQIAYVDHQVRIDVIDDGAGAASESIGSGLGIRGMRERAAAVGGQLEAGPLPGRGFRMHATLPTAGP